MASGHTLCDFIGLTIAREAFGLTLLGFMVLSCVINQQVSDREAVCSVSCESKAEITNTAARCQTRDATNEEYQAGASLLQTPGCIGDVIQGERERERHCVARAEEMRIVASFGVRRSRRKYDWPAEARFSPVFAAATPEKRRNNTT